MTKEIKNIVSLFQLVLIVLSILSVVMLLIDLLVELDPQISHIIQMGDLTICGFFIYDFLFRLIKSDNKLKFMKWGWIDLISSIPTLDIFRAGRLIRVIRLLRLIRLLRASQTITQFILNNRQKNISLSALFVAMFLLFTGSVGILMVELPDPQCNIKTAGDALWWSFVTITTVGYKSLYPVTSEGRIIASILMIARVALLSTFTGLIASWFLSGKRK